MKIRTFFPNHDIILVVRVVCIPELTIIGKFEFHELMPELALVPDIIPAVKLFSHGID
jgi:hypothetical protein